MAGGNLEECQAQGKIVLTSNNFIRLFLRDGIRVLFPGRKWGKTEKSMLLYLFPSYFWFLMAVKKNIYMDLFNIALLCRVQLYIYILSRPGLPPTPDAKSSPKFTFLLNISPYLSVKNFIRYLSKYVLHLNSLNVYLSIFKCMRWSPQSDPWS